MTESKLREAFALVSEAFAAAGYPERVADAFEFLDANELGIALEHVCWNLYEFECPVPLRAYELFAEAGAGMNMESSLWEVLQPQVVA